jgi:hypothetical protein
MFVLALGLEKRSDGRLVNHLQRDRLTIDLPTLRTQTASMNTASGCQAALVDLERSQFSRTRSKLGRH